MRVYGVVLTYTEPYGEFLPGDSILKYVQAHSQQDAFDRADIEGETIQIVQHHQHIDTPTRLTDRCC